MNEQQEQPKAKPRNVSELWAEEVEPRPKEEPEDKPGPLEMKAEAEDAPEQEGDIPSWALNYLPEGFKVPKGKQVSFIRFRSKWTDAPDKGVLTLYPKKIGQGEAAKVVMVEELTRVLVCWTINDAEEKHALQRARDQKSVLQEYTKQMIRAVDGLRVDWTGDWAKQGDGQLISVQQVWKELGAKGRNMLKHIYQQTHSLTDEELADFFVNCFVSTSAVAG